MLVIKLGGSVITDKSSPLTPRPENIKRLAREIGTSTEPKILVHGGGSFGHFGAAEYGLHEGFREERQREGIFMVQKDMRTLNQMVVDAFYEIGTPVASIPAGAITVFDDGEIVTFPSDVFSHYLDLGIMPMTFGDVVVDRSKGVAICSGDDLMLRLVRDLEADRCVFVTGIDGIYANFPPADGAEPLAEVRPDMHITFKEVDVDVTGSMERKLELMFKMARTGCRVEVINGLVPDRLADAFAGRAYKGSLILGD